MDVEANFGSVLTESTTFAATRPKTGNGDSVGTVRV
jgi:hypothetical protein